MVERFQEWKFRVGVMLLSVLAILAHADSSRALMRATAGYDYSSGAEGRITRGALGALTWSGNTRSLTLAGIRYVDSEAGAGVSLTAGAAIAVVPSHVNFQASATRFLGDQEFRAYRIKAGPQLMLPGGTSLGVFAAHYSDNAGESSNGLGLESESPLAGALSAHGSASYAGWSDGTRSEVVSAGLGVGFLSRCSLSGDVGLARNATGAGAGFLPGHKKQDGLPLLGGGGGSTDPGSTPSEDHFSGVASLGFRVTFP